MTRLTLSAALAALLLACGESAGASKRGGVDPAAIPIEVVDLEGLEAALEARRGSGMLLNFWAMWCAPCVAELPELVEVGREYRERGGQVVGVSYDLMVAGADREGMDASLRRFLVARDLELDVLVYDEDDYDSLNERFELPGEIPVTLAIDATGAIVDREEGQASKERFAEMMEKALGS